MPTRSRAHSSPPSTPVQFRRGRHRQHASISPPQPLQGALLPVRPSKMASGFIGISVIVTLQNPPNTLVHGVVAAVNPQNATLTLQDGVWASCPALFPPDMCLFC